MKFLIFPFILFLSSCTLLDPYSVKYNDNLSSVVKYSYPNTKLLASAIVKLSKDDQDMQKKKLIMLNLADLIDSFNLPTHPTPESVIENITKLLPDKTHWNFLAVNIAENYEIFLTENEKVTVDTVSQFFSNISKALREVATN